LLALGVLAGLLAGELALLNVFGSDAWLAFLATCAMVGLGLGTIGAAGWLVAVDLAMVAVYLAVAFTPIASGPASRWVRNDPPSRVSLDAVVVLSGGIRSDSSLGVAGAERLLTGLELVRAGVAPRLVTTRIVLAFGKRVVDSDIGQGRLVHLVGEESAWVVSDTVYTTRDEATRVARLLLPNGSRNIAVVTSPVHTRRACAAFEAVGFRVRCVAAREYGYNTRHPASPDDRLEAAREYLYERLGTMKYRWKGWLPPSTP
jgi:uncharacterized SAM-binding protein YcdF (DUF218 family)